MKEEGTALRQVRAPHHAPPRFIQLFPTLRCNRSCGFCFNRGMGPCADMDIEDFGELAEVLRAVGIREIDLLGGEPTLHPGFSRMADIIRETGLTATFSTNGSNVPLLEKTAREHPRHIRPGVSINSTPVPRGLHRCILKHKPMVKSLCTSTGGVPEAARAYLGMRGVEYYFIYPDVLNSSDLEAALPFPEYLERLEGLKRSYGNVQGVHCGFIPPPGRRHVRCPAGTTKLSVLPDGSAYPCYLLFRHGEFRLGNILKDGFGSLWENPVLDIFRRFEGNPCPAGECGLFSLCHGGCPAVGLLLTGDIHAPDPRCGKPTC